MSSRDSSGGPTSASAATPILFVLGTYAANLLNKGNRQQALLLGIILPFALSALAKGRVCHLPVRVDYSVLAAVYWAGLLCIALCDPRSAALRAHANLGTHPALATYVSLSFGVVYGLAPQSRRSFWGGIVTSLVLILARVFLMCHAVGGDEARHLLGLSLMAHVGALGGGIVLALQLDAFALRHQPHAAVVCLRRPRPAVLRSTLSWLRELGRRLCGGELCRGGAATPEGDEVRRPLRRARHRRAHATAPPTPPPTTTPPSTTSPPPTTTPPFTTCPDHAVHAAPHPLRRTHSDSAEPLASSSHVPHAGAERRAGLPDGLHRPRRRPRPLLLRAPAQAARGH
eukprot:7391516-Prymnesium_polylepis.1